MEPDRSKDGGRYERALTAVLDSVGNSRPLLSFIGKREDVHIKQSQLETGKEHLPCVRH